MVVVHFKSNRIIQSVIKTSQYRFHHVPDICSFDIVLPGAKYPTYSKYLISFKKIHQLIRRDYFIDETIFSIDKQSIVLIRKMKG